MEMHQVRYFLAVAQTLNFTRAASICNVAQPSLTRAIQKLEEELGGLLIHRERGQTHLTDLGRLMQPHLERTFIAAQSAKALADSIRAGDRATLKVGTSHAVATEMLSGLLDQLHNNIPGFELSLVKAPEHDLVERAIRGDLDILFMAEIDNLPDRMRSWLLFREPVKLIMAQGNPLAAQASVGLQDLRNETLVWNSTCPDQVRLVHALLGAEGQAGLRHAACNQFDMQELVRLGFGVGLLPEHVPTVEGVTSRPLDCSGATHDVLVAIVAGRPFSRATESCLRLARARQWVGETAPA